jgi:hypothetical protein
MKKDFSTTEASSIASKLGAKMTKSGTEQFRKGLHVELEHGKDAINEGVNANLTNDDPIKTGKIALAHINEIPKYYDGLSNMESKEKSKKGVLKSILVKNIKK